MKALLIALLMLTAFPASADEDLGDLLGRGIHKESDADIGQIEVKVSDQAEEGYDVMTVSVLCNDRRKVKTAVTPKWETIPDLTDVPVCYFRGLSKINRATKKVSAHYSMSSVPRVRPDEKIRPLGFECNNHVRSIVDLVKWCSPWR